MKRLFGLVAMLVVFLPTLSFAQQDLLGPTTMEQQVMLSRDGSATINGQPANQHSIETLSDRYVLRYKAIDSPGKVIDQLTIRLILPSTVTVNAVKPNIIAVHGVGETHIVTVNSRTIDFQAIAIGPEATITITVDMPHSALSLSTGRQVVADLTLLSPAGALGLSSIIPFLILLFTAGIFISRFRDISLKPVVGKTLPSRLPPAYVGVLLTGNVGSKEIAATIIDLAQRGYIDIVYKRDGSYGFSKKKDWQYDKTLLEFERRFLDQLTSDTFVNSDENINQKLNSHVWSEGVSQGIELIYAEMARLGYFPTNPKKSHLTIRTLGIALFFISAIGVGLTLFYFGQQPLVVVPWLVSLCISPLIIRLALLVPRRTLVGRQQAALWLGIKQYLVADKFFQYPEDAQHFETYLAYAIVFGVEGRWTARFLKIPCQLPDWFYSENMLIEGYQQLSEALFGVIATISQRFSMSRKPTAV